MYQWLLLFIIFNSSFAYSINDTSFVNIASQKFNVIVAPISSQSLLNLLATSNKSSIVQASPTLFTPTSSSLRPKVIAKEPYNRKWFTQGFYKDNKSFYISSGLYNQSVLIYQSPSKNLRYFLPPQYFAEGLTVIDDKLFLLTWREETLFIFDKNTLTPINKINYQGQGWGLTHNETSFIMSNGSNILKFRNKNTFEVERTLTIKNLDNINELEYIAGVIWANRWHDEKIYAINSNNGCILTSIDLSELRMQSAIPDQNNVVNGIAYDEEKNGLWVTGKFWDYRFLIALPPLNKTHCINQ